MSDFGERLARLQTELPRQVSQVLSVGLAVEPAGGTSADWKALRNGLGVAPMGEEARFASARNAKMARGAPLEEVSACLGCLAGAGWAELEALRGGLDPTVASRLGALIQQFPAQALEEYRRLACDRPKGMFAHARAAAERHQYSKWQKSGGYVLTCPNCGGPRLRTTDLVCEFCGGHVGA